MVKKYPPRRITIQRAAFKYWRLHGSKKASFRNYRLYLSRITQFFRNRYIDTITYMDVQDFREWLSKAKKAAPTSINKHQTVLTHIFHALRKWAEMGIIRPVTLPDVNPGSLVKKAPLVMRSRILSPPEIQKIRAASGPELRDVIDMGFNTLLRLKDLKRLTLKNVNQANNSLEGIQAKTGKPYSIPINREIRKIIDKALRQGRQMLLNCPNFRKEFEAMREGLPILYFQFRDIRRTGARYLLKNGVDLATVQGMLGHADIEMTQIYIQPEHKDKKKASQKLGGIIA